MQIKNVKLLCPKCGSENVAEVVYGVLRFFDRAEVRIQQQNRRTKFRTVVIPATKKGLRFLATP